MAKHSHKDNRGLSWQDVLLPVLALAIGAATLGALTTETTLWSGELSGLADMPQLIALISGAAFVDLVIAPLVLFRQYRRPLRSRGRMRITAAALGALVHGAGLLVLTEGLSGTVGSKAGASLAPAVLGGGLLVLGSAISVGAAAACWPLLPRTVRSALLVGTDVALLVAAGYAVAALPTEPPPSTPDDLRLPILRHAITTCFALRLISRMLPMVLDSIERFGFRPLVASRHLRSKKSGFLAAISVLSVLAVTVSSCALTTTLSVMGGFRQDLKRKILGNNAHIVIDRPYATIENWSHDLARTKAMPGVIGAAPYANGEVMISSAANLGTAVLRGIEPAEIGKVNDLPNNLRSGRLSYLSHPDKLLELPPDLDSLISPLAEDGGQPDPPLEDAGLPDAGPAASTSQAVGAEHGRALANTTQGDSSTAGEGLPRRLIALEDFMKHTPLADEIQRQAVLPGIIIGQELARSLRVYLGDEVNVVAPLGALGPTGPMPKSRPFRVAGIFYSGMYEYDIKFTYVTLDTAQRFLGIGHAISGIEVRVDHVDHAPAIAARLRQELKTKGLRVQDWQNLNSRLFGALALEKLAMFIALGIAILVASFCIAGTLTLMVQEKGREVAILKAMGTTDRAIVGVFVIEGGLIGLLGATLGLFLGYMMCFAATHFGIRMNPEVYYIDRLPVHIDPTEFALTGLAAVMVCLLITVYPALLASRLRPVEALRYE